MIGLRPGEAASFWRPEGRGRDGITDLPLESHMARRWRDRDEGRIRMRWLANFSRIWRWGGVVKGPGRRRDVAGERAGRRAHQGSRLTRIGGGLGLALVLALIAADAAGADQERRHNPGSERPALMVNLMPGAIETGPGAAPDQPDQRVRPDTASERQGAGFALRFYGHGQGDIDRVKIPLDPPVPADVSGDFTLEFWLKANPNDNGGGPCQAGGDNWIYGHTVFDRDVFGAGDFGDYGISLAGGRVAFGVNNGTWGETICGSRLVTDGFWHHIAVTRQTVSGQLRLFVDGQADGSGAGPTGGISYRDGRPTGWPNDPYLVIGAEKHDVDPVTFPSFRGWIDEVRLSATVRYNGNFQRPRDPFVPDGDTLALYHFDEGSGDVVGDSALYPGGPSPGERRFGDAGQPPAGPAWVVSDAPLGGVWTPTFLPVLLRP